jgi:DNA-binding beta-propeller fold protein YncE
MITKKKLLIVVAIVAVVFAPLVLSSTLRRALIDGPLKGPYLRYSKWRHNWRGPSDVGDGKNALQVIIEGPMGIGEDTEGNIILSDREGKFVWKIEKSGRAVVIAGTGKPTGARGLPEGRTPALEVDLAMPEGLVVDRDGSILLTDSYNHVIHRIDREGYLTRFAGNGVRGRGGEGVKALESSFAFPCDVRLDSKGNIFVADLENHRIRKITRDGIVTTVAGTGVPGYSGDGGPALDAQLNSPWGILIDKDDNLLIADSNNDAIRKVGSDGIIHTIAGNGQEGYEGDGGPATSAKLNTPQSLAIDAAGRIYIGDEHNDAIRVVELDGTIKSFIGSKGPGYSGDGGPASQAQIADPENLWFRKDGSLLISVRDNARLRIVSPEGIISTLAGKGPTSRHDYFGPITIPSVEP